jgi:hypothetical protein
MSVIRFPAMNRRYKKVGSGRHLSQLPGGNVESVMDRAGEVGRLLNGLMSALEKQAA